MRARATCEERLQQCNELVEVADRAIKQQGETISLQSEQINDLKFNYKVVKNQLEEQQRDSAAWYKQPAIIIPLSFVLGAYVFSQVGR